MTERDQPERQSRPTAKTAGWRTLAGTGTSANAALAVLVFVTVFAAMAIPRASLGLRTNALQQIFAELPSAARTMTTSIDYPSFNQSEGGGNVPAQLASIREQLTGHMTAAKAPIEPADSWSSVTTANLATFGVARRAYYGPSAPVVQLVYRDALRRDARLLAGTWPDAVTQQGKTSTYQMAVTPASAGLFQLKV